MNRRAGLLLPLFALGAAGCAPPSRDAELEQWLAEQARTAQPLPLPPIATIPLERTETDLSALHSPFQPPRPLKR